MALQDNAQGREPAYGCRAVTPNDGADLPDGACRGIIVGGAGDVEVDDLTGTTTILPSVAVGVHWLGAVRIRDANTAATGIVAIY
jgi:hypothetical protein